MTVTILNFIEVDSPYVSYPIKKTKLKCVSHKGDIIGRHYSVLVLSMKFIYLYKILMMFDGYTLPI